MFLPVICNVVATALLEGVQVDSTYSIYPIRKELGNSRILFGSHLLRKARWESACFPAPHLQRPGDVEILPDRSVGPGRHTPDSHTAFGNCAFALKCWPLPASKSLGTNSLPPRPWVSVRTVKLNTLKTLSQQF